MSGLGTLLRVVHVVRGVVVDEPGITYESSDLGTAFTTPTLDLNGLVWARNERFPALDMPIDEVVDFLVSVGDALSLDSNRYLQDALDALVLVNPLAREQLELHFRALPQLFRRDLLEFEYDEGMGRVNENWHRVDGPRDHSFEVRAFPARTIHVMAGNGPANASLAVIRTALTKGVGLLKLPSNDLFTAPAILRTMAELDQSHPVVQSLSVAYWRGGDESVESVLYRPQFFDKIVAWGGDSAIRNVVKYLGPGLELVSFDPKTSVSMIGAEAHVDRETLANVAARAALDVRYQEGCTTSRFQYIEGTLTQVDQYCEALLGAMFEAHERVGGVCAPTPPEIRSEVEGLRLLEPTYRAWGTYDGTGLVVRSEEPVDFYPEARTVNVVRVESLLDALRYVNVATQTVGVYPSVRKEDLRDALASIGGVDRIVDLGKSSLGATGGFGSPHDGMYPLRRLVRWIYCDA